MKSTTRVAAFLAAALSATLALATPSGAAPPSPVLPPPSADVFVTTSNAMMRPSDVPASLLPDEAWSVSYHESARRPGPVPGVHLRRRGGPSTCRCATPWATSRGAYGLTQVVYAYASPASARAAWATVNRQVPAKCSGEFMLGDSTTTVTSGRLAATATTPAGWWVRTDVAGAAAGASYVTVRPVGDSIQMVFLSNISEQPDPGPACRGRRAEPDSRRAARRCRRAPGHAGSPPHVRPAGHDHLGRRPGLAALHPAGERRLVELPVLRTGQRSVGMRRVRSSPQAQPSFESGFGGQGRRHCRARGPGTSVSRCTRPRTRPARRGGS